RRLLSGWSRAARRRARRGRRSANTPTGLRAWSELREGRPVVGRPGVGPRRRMIGWRCWQLRGGRGGGGRARRLGGRVGRIQGPADGSCEGAADGVAGCGGRFAALDRCHEVAESAEEPRRRAGCYVSEQLHHALARERRAGLEPCLPGGLPSLGELGAWPDAFGCEGGLPGALEA